MTDVAKQPQGDYFTSPDRHALLENVKYLTLRSRRIPRILEPDVTEADC